MIGNCENDISSSEYLASYHKVKESSTPNFDLDLEFDVQQAVIELIEQDL